MSIYGKHRSKIRGKPFKLFSDELPNFEYGDTNETDPFKDAREPRRSRGRKKRFQSFNDRLSLPSLGTPERDDISVTMSESRISSSQSTNPNVMSPDLQELHSRIRNRHGIRDSPPSRPAIGLPRRSKTLKASPTDRPVVVKRDTLVKDRGKFDDKRKGGTIEKHIDRYENAFTEEFSKGDNKQQTDENSTQPKSILQQLLDASARDFHKRKQINDGLIPSPIDPLYRSPSVRLSSGDKRRPPASVSTQGTTKVERERKPGILKRESLNRHSMKVPKVPGPSGPSPKPRLVHNEDLEDFEDYASRYVPSPGAVVSVHLDVPRNKANDMLLLPQKKSKPKRVYFKDNDELHNLPANENDEEFDNDSRLKSRTRKPSRHRKSSPYPNDEIDIKFESRGTEDDKSADVKTTLNKESNDLSRTHSLKPVSRKRQGRSSPYTRKDIRDNEENGETKSIQDDFITNRRESGLMEVKPRRDIPSATFFAEDQDAIFPSPSPRKEIHFLGADDLNASTSRRRQTANNLKSFFDSMKPDSRSSSRSGTPRSTKLRRAESERTSRPLNIPPLLIQNENGGHFNEHFTGSRNPEAIGLDELPDDFDLSELPEDIDRSLDGVELIKAYRLWDRERKAFPAGLRKIDIPFDPRDFILSKLRNANAKSQRSQKQEVKVTLV